MNLNADYGRAWTPSASSPRRASTFLMLPDFERADRIGEFWSYPESRTFAELLIDCEEDRTLRACAASAWTTTSNAGSMPRGVFVVGGDHRTPIRRVSRGRLHGPGLQGARPRLPTATWCGWIRPAGEIVV